MDMILQMNLLMMFKNKIYIIDKTSNECNLLLIKFKNKKYFIYYKKYINYINNYYFINK